MNPTENTATTARQNSPLAVRAARRSIESETTADLYRDMALDIRRKFDPAYKVSTVNEEVQRLLRLAAEMDQDAKDEMAVAIARGFDPELGL